METPTLTPPARQGCLRRLFSWRTVRKVLFVIAALITLAALFLAEEHWRGSRAWANYKHDMEAKGEHFDIARLIPPKVPDAENFAMTPFLATLFTPPPGDPGLPFKDATNKFGDTYYAAANRGTNIAPPWFDRAVNRRHPLGWNYGMAGDLNGWAAAIQDTNSAPPSAEITDPVQAARFVLDTMKSCESTLAELHSAAARRYSRFNISYEQWDKPDNFEITEKHFVVAKWLFRFLTLHAQAEMVSGHTDEALKDLNVMFRLDDGLKDEPLLISQLVRMAGISIILQSVGEGLAEHRWSEAQLQSLQDRLGKTDLLASIVLALYGERDICVNPSFDRGYMYMSPRGWNRLEQLNLNRAVNQTLLPRFDLAAREINPSVNHAMDLAFQTSYGGSGFSAFLHHNIMATMTLPVYSHVGEKAALAQSGVDLALVACALERCRLALGHYPEQLNDLVPRFAAALPHDIINGQPLKYRRLENGRFILYSVGWNEKDDGGVVATTKGTTPRQDNDHGDWVLQYPEHP
jgi:hypothetical protein